MRDPLVMTDDTKPDDVTDEEWTEFQKRAYDAGKTMRNAALDGASAAQTAGAVGVDVAKQVASGAASALASAKDPVANAFVDGAKVAADVGVKAIGAVASLPADEL